MRRLIAAIAVLTLAAVPVAAATPAPVTPPAGAVVVVVGISDGMTVLPVGQAVVPPLACDPGGRP